MARAPKKPVRLIAYDLETTRIEAGTPELLYITAFGAGFKVSLPIKGKDRYKHLCDILETHFLQPELSGVCYIAWNAKKFDAYFIALALLQSSEWLIQPYLTTSKQLRGFRVRSKEKVKGKYLTFQFLDGMSMTGLTGLPLGDKLDAVTGKTKKGFLSVFAPEFPKLSLDLDKELFDPINPYHVEYAERDSEALYYAMVKVNEIVLKLTGSEIRPTIGNLAIRYFLQRLPGDILKYTPDRIVSIVHNSVKRGGYSWVSRQYKGKVWKYDLNQAYAAAMRECRLPCGDIVEVSEYVAEQPGIYLCEFERSKKTKVPFYYKPVEDVGKYSDGRPGRAWITNMEVEHLRADNWRVDVLHGFIWEYSFNMRGMVDDLETLRLTDPDGPGGPLGTMVKAVGNNAYGKTLEQLNNIEMIFAKECPPGYEFYDPNDAALSNVFCRERTAFAKPYHHPEIGSFITAHVRMVVREAALKMESSFLYADTDCVVFDKPALHLDIHATRYGAWKVEAAGDLYIIIAKKVYASGNGDMKAKGLSVKKLRPDMYEEWMNGVIPEQMQTQRQNFIKFLGGAKMFIDESRKGTNVAKIKNVRVVNGEFIPV